MWFTMVVSKVVADFVAVELFDERRTGSEDYGRGVYIPLAFGDRVGVSRAAVPHHVIPIYSYSPKPLGT